MIVAAVLFFAVTLLKILVKKFSFYAKITMAVIGIIVGVAALFIGTLFPQFQSLLVDETYTREKFAASAVTNRLPADAFQRLEKPSDFMNEDYRQVRQVVRDVFFSDSDSSQDLYCVLYKVKDGTVPWSIPWRISVCPIPMTGNMKAQIFRRLWSRGLQKPMLQTQAPEALYLSIVPSGIKAEILLGL